MKPSEMENFNQQGLFPGPGESEKDFISRISNLKTWSYQLKKKDLKLQDLSYALPHSERLNETQLRTSGEPIQTRYGIMPDWVPAYYYDRGMPMLTGGMAIQFIEKENEPIKTFFQLKSVFKTKKKWIIYTADELIRHEMCHVARAAMQSTRFEETFAYSTSDSWLRRKIGGALNTPFDNQLVIISLLMWMCASFLPNFFPSIQAWIKVFYLPFPLVVTLGLVRNVYIRKEIKLSSEKLKHHFQKDHEKVLFRLSDSEIKALSKMKDDEVINWWHSLEGFRGDFLRANYSVHG